VTVARDDSSALMASIERMLHERIGLDVTTVGSSLVERAVQRRVVVCGMRSVGDYVARLNDDEQELQELVEAVVIPETYFFREPEALQALAQRLTSQTPWPTSESPLRVLSAPCSTGEEPYSIAMTMLAAGIPASALSIDAIDVSYDAVRRARRAAYRGASFRGAAFDWRPYFDDIAGERVLQATVRETVRVTQGNLFDPAFSAPRASYDVVFCRNLLIYFDAGAQERVLATLTSLLAPDGILVVGAADSFAVRRAGFVPVSGAERAFLFQYRPHEDSRAASPPRPRTMPLAPRRRSVPRNTPPAARRAVGVAPLPAAPSESAALSESAVDTVTRLANEGRLTEAAHVGETSLAHTGPDAELLALLGTTYAALSDEARAEGCYRRALYLDPHHAEALLHLALILDRRGDRGGASRLRMRARRGIATDAPVTNPSEGV
jgi:chemotaxis protein methyltransferase WspC